MQLIVLMYLFFVGFRKHMQERHNKKPFPCQQCGISYNHKANLEDHIKAKHSSKEYPCDKCGKVILNFAKVFFLIMINYFFREMLQHGPML